MFQEYANKKILILGLGIEGQSTLKLLRKFLPDKIIGVADSTTMDDLTKNIKRQLITDKNINLHFGTNYLKSINQYDVIFKSPGISPFIHEIIDAEKDGKIVTSQTEIFFDNVDIKKVIGITGTKGKSTTTSLIFEILKKANRNPLLVGNIGIPPLEALKKSKKDNIFVYEISSYQASDLKRQSPHVAVFLNIYPEHLDYHKNFNNYLKAKKNIFIHQKNNDYLIINNLFRNLITKTKSKIYLFDLNKKVKNGCYLNDKWIIFKDKTGEEKIINEKEITLNGKFNLQNVMAAIITTKIFGVGKLDIRKALKKFQPLPHRLKKIGTYKGVTFYDDSISTIPQTTIAAIDTLGDNVETLILGGHDRKINFDILAKKLSKSKVKNLILFPPSGKRIWQVISKANRKINHYSVNDMETAISIVFEHTNKGKICLLSPASPSYGIFKNYKDRGEAFIREIKKQA